MDKLNTVLEDLIEVIFKTKDTMNKKDIKDVDVTITFGGYANPSFEAQIETISKGKTGGIMSIEASVDELYGDSKTQEWKQQEVARLKAEKGIVEEDIPAVNGELDINEIDIEDTPQNTENAENKEIDKQEKGLNE